MNAIEKKHEEICMQDYDDTQPSDHATITKDTSIGFKRWCTDNDLALCIEHGRDLTDDELYDIYVKSLEGS